MTIDTSLQGRDIYVRTTDAEGNVSHTEHRVWDVGLFMNAREVDAQRANAKTGGDKARCEQITRDQFKAKA